MESKYYIPEIEDIHIGYECEVHIHSYGQGWRWEPHIYPAGGTLPLEIKAVRTPYLTKEQIESEGWEDKTLKLNIGSWIFEKDNWRATYMFTTKLMWMMGLSEDKLIKVDSVFKGKCPSINEFRKICKLLGI